MVELIGTDKQVKWAEDIRKNAIEKIGRIIEEAENWGTSTPLRTKSYEKYKAHFENLKNEESAVFWIEKFGYKKFYWEFTHTFNDYVTRAEGNDIVVQKMRRVNKIAEQIDNNEVLGI